VTRVALHADQPFFQAPGGIGTYVRNLVPALAHRDPALEITLSRPSTGRSARSTRGGPCSGGRRSPHPCAPPT
jgi:hypothetical protein